MEQFTLAAEKDDPLNTNFKSFVNVAKVLEVLESTAGAKLHPHGAQIEPHYYSHDGQPLDSDRIFGKSKTVSWQHARIRHYVVKSYAEYLRGKVLRGGGDFSGNPDHYNLAFFETHDRNEVSEGLPPVALEALSREMDRLTALTLRSSITGGKQLTSPLLTNLETVWMSRPFGGSSLFQLIERTGKLAISAVFDSASPFYSWKRWRSAAGASDRLG